MTTFLKALRIRYKLFRGDDVPTSETMPLALRYRWLFKGSPSTKAMLAAHDGAKAFVEAFEKARAYIEALENTKVKK